MVPPVVKLSAAAEEAMAEAMQAAVDSDDHVDKPMQLEIPGRRPRSNKLVETNSPAAAAQYAACD